jgi:DNA-binding transcriptional LysR family regulator
VVKTKDLAGVKFIGFEADIPTRKAIDRIFKEQGVMVDYAMEFDNIETVKRAVEIDAGISIVPRGTITQEVSKQTLAEAKIENVDLVRPLALIYKKNKVLSPALKEFISILKS